MTERVYYVSTPYHHCFTITICSCQQDQLLERAHRQDVQERRQFSMHKTNHDEVPMLLITRTIAQFSILRKSCALPIFMPLILSCPMFSLLLSLIPPLALHFGVSVEVTMFVVFMRSGSRNSIYVYCINALPLSILSHIPTKELMVRTPWPANDSVTAVTPAGIAIERVHVL
jgi:hypothetical protein